MFGKKADLLTRYVDPTKELPNQELALANWYVRHKEQLQRFGIGLLMIWSVLSIAFGIWQWGEYLLFGYVADEQLLVQLNRTPNYTLQHGRSGAQALAIGAIDIFETTPKKYDIAAEVRNPNARWVATLTYKFTTAAGETPVQTTVLLPKAVLPVIAFGYESSAYPSSPQLIIVATRWQRINPHVVTDVDRYMAERLTFPVSHVSWKPADASNGRTVPELSFDIQNATAYSYWQPVFIVTLRTGSQSVGYLYLTFDKFLSSETRSVKFHLISDRVSVGDIDITPAVNVFDRSVYIEP